MCFEIEMLEKFWEVLWAQKYMELIEALVVEMICERRLRRWVGENVVKKLSGHRQEAEVHTISHEF